MNDYSPTLALCRLLAYDGLLPFRDRDLVAIFDHCVEYLLLRRVGDGWIFIHRMLLVHFASHDVEPTAPDQQSPA